MKITSLRDHWVDDVIADLERWRFRAAFRTVVRLEQFRIATRDCTKFATTINVRLPTQYVRQ
jgi:hypothetical protein